MLNKKAQEEMVGFAIIIIIVAVILLIFLGYSVQKPKEVVESYEIESFIQSMLQYTTECAQDYEPNYDSIEELIISCKKNEQCLNGKESCIVLEKDLSEIMELGWEIYEDSPIKGYNLKINSGSEVLIELGDGNLSNNYKSSHHALGKESINIQIYIYS